MKPSAHRIAAALALLAGAAALAVNVFAHLGSPLLWYDEAETAVFGQRILTYGYPKVHDRGVVFYNINLPLETGRKESIDAYIGTPWAHFYVAAAGELFARRATDLHERTARVRLPFAATGVAGVFLIAVALAPAAAAGGAARAVFVGAYLALATLSTFLVLHLREARYYPLVVFEVGLLLVVHLRHAAYGRGRRGAYTALVATLLVALFLTFYPMCAAAAAALAVDAVWRARRAGGGWRARGRAAAADLAPVALAGVAIVPLLAFFETLHVAAAFSERLQFTRSMFVDNVRALSSYLLRQDALIPAVLTHGAWLVAARGPRHRDAGEASARDAAAFLWILVIIHALVASFNPVLWGRYFVTLTPLLLAILCLAAARAMRARRAVGAAAAAASVALFVVLQWPFLTGRLAEIREPVRGPLDFAIPFLRERYERPQDLVIATNYERPSLMYYLGSEVIEVPRPGDPGPLPPADPDVVIPRRWWNNAARLQEYLRGRSWLEERFPVVDVPYNNIPEIVNVSRRLTWLHQFRTPVPTDPRTQFLLYWRAPAMPPTR